MPYDLVKDKLKNKEYRLITYKDRENVNITFSYNKNRKKSFLQLGRLLNNISSQKPYIEYLKRKIEESPNSDYVSSWKKELKEYKDKIEVYMEEIHEIYKEFAIEHSFYLCPVKVKNNQKR